MNLNDFGTNVTVRRAAAPHRPVPAQMPKRNGRAGPPQWQMVRSGVYQECGPAGSRLPAGAYACEMYLHTPRLIEKEIRADDLLDLPDSVAVQILAEIERFWSLGEQFGRCGFLHRRGYLLYGPQGSGKSSVVHQVVRQIVAAGHVALFGDDPRVLGVVLDLFRRIEPDRSLVCVFEDIDAIIERYGESELLNLLDGWNQVDRVVNMATTNYPEMLDRRLVCRPRRFDRILKIENPSAELRTAYLARKLSHLGPGELAGLVEQTAGLSFAAQAELVISVFCLGNPVESILATLHTIEDREPSSREFEKPGGMGFASRNGPQAK